MRNHWRRQNKGGNGAASGDNALWRWRQPRDGLIVFGEDVAAAAAAAAAAVDVAVVVAVVVVAVVVAVVVGKMAES